MLKLLSPFTPYLIAGGIALAIGGGWYGYNWVYDRGVSHERAEWEAETARLRVVAAEEALKRREAVDDANLSAAASRSLLEALSATNDTDTRNHYAQHPDRNRVCLSPERVRSIEESDKAALAAATAD